MWKVDKTCSGSIIRTKYIYLLKVHFLTLSIFISLFIYPSLYLYLSLSLFHLRFSCSFTSTIEKYYSPSLEYVYVSKRHNTLIYFIIDLDISPLSAEELGVSLPLVSHYLSITGSSQMLLISSLVSAFMPSLPCHRPERLFILFTFHNSSYS